MNNNDDFDTLPNDDSPEVSDKDTLAAKENDTGYDAIDPDLNLSVGQTLAQLRENKNLQIEQVADNLRLDITTVENLEKDNYERLPPAIFIQGYIRCYAKLLDIDPEQLIRQYYEQEGNAPDLQYAAPQNIQSNADRTALNEERKKKKGGSSALSSLALLLLFIAGAVVLWQQGYINKDLFNFSFLQSESEDNTIRVITDPGLAPPNLPNTDGTLAAPIAPDLSASSESTTYTPPQEENDEESTATTLEAETADNNNDATTETETTDNPTLTPATETETASNEENTDTNAATATEENTTTTETEEAPVVVEAPKPPVDKLEVSFSGASWTEVHDAAGKRLYYRTSKAGTSHSFSGVPPFKLKMGKPEKTTVRYLGETMNLKRYYGRVTTLKIGKAQ